jgi:hypothetical protein
MLVRCRLYAAVAASRSPYAQLVSASSDRSETETLFF